MSAFEHPSARRTPVCMCDTEYAAMGCEVCDDKPNPVGKLLKCAICGCDTFNVVTGECARCMKWMAEYERGCADIRPPMQTIPVLCTYCHARASRHWSMICHVCSEMGA